jgi:hypothetical protein
VPRYDLQRSGEGVGWKCHELGEFDDRRILARDVGLA